MAACDGHARQVQVELGSLSSRLRASTMSKLLSFFRRKNRGADGSAPADSFSPPVSEDVARNNPSS